MYEHWIVFPAFKNTYAGSEPRGGGVLPVNSPRRCLSQHIITRSFVFGQAAGRRTPGAAFAVVKNSVFTHFSVPSFLDNIIAYLNCLGLLRLNAVFLSPATALIFWLKGNIALILTCR